MNEYERYIGHCTSTYSNSTILAFIRFGIDKTIIGINLIDVYRFAGCPNVSSSWHSFDSSSSSTQNFGQCKRKVKNKTKNYYLLIPKQRQWSNASFELNSDMSHFVSQQHHINDESDCIQLTVNEID